jgi:hypothetical protein
MSMVEVGRSSVIDYALMKFSNLVQQISGGARPFYDLPPVVVHTRNLSSLLEIFVGNLKLAF